MRKVRRWAPRALGAAFVLVLVAYLGISYRVADGVTQLERKPLVPAATAVSANYEDVSFRARDGLLLKGWFFPAAPTLRAPSGGLLPVDRAVVFVHGRGQNRIASSFRPDLIAPILIAHGYDVLLFDLRGHGESEGLRYSLGEYEPRDILGAIDFVAQKTGIKRDHIAVLGESLGGGSAIMTVAADPTIGPVVTDSAYADGYTVVSEVGTNYTGLPSWFTPGIVLMGKLFLDLDVASVRPADVVRAHPERAWLFIQCTDDKTVFAHHGTDLKAASANPNTELWMPTGCDHVKAFTTHPQEWESRVLSFLDRELARAAAAATP